MNKNLFAKADSLVDKVLSSPRIKLSTPNLLILDGTDSGVPLTEFPQTLKRKNAEVPDIYFTLLDVADITPRLVLNKNAKEKERRSWVPLKIRETKTAEVVQRRLCSLWFSQKLDNGKQTLVSEVQYFLHSKSSYTGFNQATRKFRRMRAFARFKKEIWCMHLAFVDKLPKDNNGVKYLLVRQDMFDRTVDANKRFKRNR